MTDTEINEKVARCGNRTGKTGGEGCSQKLK